MGTRLYKLYDSYEQIYLIVSNKQRKLCNAINIFLRLNAGCYEIHSLDTLTYDLIIIQLQTCRCKLDNSRNMIMNAFYNTYNTNVF